MRREGLQTLCVLGAFLNRRKGGRWVGLRHPCDEALADVQKKTTAFAHAQTVLKQKVPGEIFDAEMPVLLEHFLEGRLDGELLDVLQEQREEWDLEGLPTFKQVTQRCEARNAGEARKRQSERVAKAAAANLEMLVADLRDDSEDVTRYHDMLAKVRREQDRQVCRYRRERYERGQEKTGELQTQRCNVVDMGPSPKNCHKEVAEARRLFEGDDHGCGAPDSLVLIYLDLNVCHSAATMALLAEAAKLLHLSPDFALCVRSMMRHCNTSPDHVQKTNRKVEDMLGQHAIFMSESPTTMLFDPSALNKRDQRQLTARFTLAISRDFAEDSIWLSTPAWRGHLGPQAPLVKTPDMMQPARAMGQGGIGEVKLTPKDRVCQLGVPAFKQLLEHLPLAALKARAASGGHAWSSCKCLVLNLEPGEFGELGHAVLDHFIATERSPASEDKLELAYLGLCQNYANNYDQEESPEVMTSPLDGAIVAKTVPLKRVFAGRLLSEWWETHPSAGSPEGVANPTGPPLGKPVLRACSWVGDIPVVMPEAAAKFATGTEAADTWQMEVAKFNAKHGRVTEATSDEQAGPDYESEGLTRPRDTNAVVAVHTREDELLFVAHALARFDPVEIFLEKDTGALYLAAKADAPEDNFEVGPCELFGFGLGSFDAKPLAEARQAPLPCLLADDCAMVVRASDGGAEEGVKTVMPLATAIFQCERHAGVPNVEVQGHRLAPNGTHFHRYSVQPGGALHCLEPREVAAPAVDGEGQLPLTRAGEFGAVLLGLGASIPTTGPAGVAWEMALDRMPPASLTFTKPKVWLLQRLQIQKASPRKYYKLTVG